MNDRHGRVSRVEVRCETAADRPSKDYQYGVYCKRLFEIEYRKVAKAALTKYL
jgi:hypothetical protein